MLADLDYRQITNESFYVATVSEGFGLAKGYGIIFFGGIEARTRWYCVGLSCNAN